MATGGGAGGQPICGYCGLVVRDERRKHIGRSALPKHECSLDASACKAAHHVVKRIPFPGAELAVYVWGLRAKCLRSIDRVDLEHIKGRDKRGRFDTRLWGSLEDQGHGKLGHHVGAPEDGVWRVLNRDGVVGYFEVFSTPGGDVDARRIPYAEVKRRFPAGPQAAPAGPQAAPAGPERVA